MIERVLFYTTASATGMLLLWLLATTPIERVG